MTATILNAVNRALVEELSSDRVPASMGWNSLLSVGAAQDKNLDGFGATAHVLARTCRWQWQESHPFICPGDWTAQAHPRSFDARKAGTVEDNTPVQLAESTTVKGGRIVHGGLHMNDIPGSGYVSLWRESDLASVAKLTRADGLELLSVARLRDAATLLP